MLGSLHIFWKMTRKYHILGVIFYFIKHGSPGCLVNIIFWLSNQKCIKKCYFGSWNITKIISISSYSVRFWGKWACPTFRGYVQGVTGFKFQTLMLIYWCYYNPHKINRVPWKNRINDPPILMSTLIFAINMLFS